LSEINCSCLGLVADTSAEAKAKGLKFSDMIADIVLAWAKTGIRSFCWLASRRLWRRIISLRRYKTRTLGVTLRQNSHPWRYEISNVSASLKLNYKHGTLAPSWLWRQKMKTLLASADDKAPGSWRQDAIRKKLNGSPACIPIAVYTNLSFWFEKNVWTKLLFEERIWSKAIISIAQLWFKKDLNWQQNILQRID